MISKKLQAAFNQQINKELYSEYLYLSMAAWFEAENLPGFAHFFKVQVQEERFHAMKMFDFINERGGKVVLKAIGDPQVEFESAEEILKLSYEHEQFISKSINELMDEAIAEKDHAAKSFLNWFVDEQVEEEATMDGILAKIKMSGGKGHGMLMIDKELSARTFAPEAE